MYQNDTPLPSHASNLSDDILKEAVFASHLRPKLDPEIISEFESKVQRTAPGYAPRRENELVDWITERIIIPYSEWETVKHAFLSTFSEDTSELGRYIAGNAFTMKLPGASRIGVVTVQSFARLTTVLPFECNREVFSNDFFVGAAVTERDFAENKVADRTERDFAENKVADRTERDDGSVPSDLHLSDPEDYYSKIERIVSIYNSEESPETIVAEFLRFYGPVSPSFLADLFGFSRGAVLDILQTLVETETVVMDELVRTATTKHGAIQEKQKEHDPLEGVRRGEQTEVCDAENLESLLRLTRRKARPRREPLPSPCVQLFFAHWHGLDHMGNTRNDFQNVLEQLFGYAANPVMWEKEIFPARMSVYYPQWLDSLLSEGRLIWAGTGDAKVYFCFPEDCGLFNGPEDSTSGERSSILPDIPGKFSFLDIVAHSSSSSTAVTETLWDEVWRGLMMRSKNWNATKRGCES